MSIKEIIPLVFEGVVIVISLISFFCLLFSYFKNSKESNSNKIITLNKILSLLPGYINEAEILLGAGNGALKLSQVLNRIENECLKSNIEFKEDIWRNEIETYLSTPHKKEC